MAIDAATAERLLVCGVAQFEQGVERLVAVTVTQGQFDALVSFAYNLGLRALENSTLLRRLNAGDRQGAADQFGRRVNAGGVRLDGLVARRAAERALFLS
ncbi:phage lysozyme [Serratia marcescens]|nr:phage lysozyme [Serratia marcescens]